MNVAEHVVAHAAIDSRRPALVFESRTVTYGELERAAGQVAEWLAHREVNRGDRVVLILPNCPEFVIAHQAVLRLGAIVVAIRHDTRASALRGILRDCGPSAVFLTPASAAELPWEELAGAPAVCVEGTWPGTTPMTDCLRGRSREPTPVAPDTPALILYTSGTTGAPKGATLSHANVEFNARAKIRYLGIRDTDRLMLFVPLAHVFGLNAILTPGLRSGATIVLHRRFHPEEVLAELAEQRITMFFAVPTVYALLLDRITPASLRSVRMWFSAAAPLPAALAQRWEERVGRPILEGYGLTETSPFTCFNHLSEHRQGSVGEAIDDVELSIVDPETREPVPTGDLGEVWIRGPNVMLGYWRRPEESAAAIVDGWFRSGDLGRLDEDGYLYLVDRLKDMIDVAGMKVWPAEVEEVLEGHPSVARAAVFRRPDPLTGDRVAAAVVLRPGAPCERSELVQWCRKHLAPSQVPTELELVAELPVSPTGKVLRRALSTGPAAARGT